MDVALYQAYLKEKGGAEKVVLELAKRSSHNVTVFTMLYDEENTFEGFKDIDIGVVGDRDSPDSFIRQAWSFGIGSMAQKLDLEDYDMLVVSETGLSSLITLRNHDLPVIAYCHTLLRAALPEFEDIYKQGFPPLIRELYPLAVGFYNSLENRAWRYFDFAFTNSETTKQRVLGKEIFDERKMEVLSPGADLETEGSNSYKKYFFYPSRFERYKRQDLAIEAFREAELGDFELVLAGSAADPHYVEELKEMIEDEENIGIETDVPGDRWKELFSNCYSVLFLPEKEDWGIVPLEAGSYEKPVIAANEGGPQESIVDEETGYLVEAEREKIAEKMELLASDTEKAEVMGQEGSEEVEKYSWEKFVDRFDEKVSGCV